MTSFGAYLDYRPDQRGALKQVVELAHRTDADVTFIEGSEIAGGREGRRRYVAVPRVAVAVRARECFDGVCRFRKPMSA